MECPEASVPSTGPPTRYEDEERELSITTDPKRRRQIQNRIAQRVYRQKQKKRIQELEKAASSKTPAHEDSSTEVSKDLTGEQFEYACWSPLAPAYPFANAITQRVTRPPSPIQPPCPTPSPKQIGVSNAGQRAVGFHSGAAAYSVPSGLQFIAIGRVSINSAVIANLGILGINPEYYALDDAASPFSECGEASICDIRHRAPDLAPTMMQRTIEHHPYIDVIPFSKLRDNILMALEADALDEGELCADIERYLRVWGRVAWDAKSYEWAPEFVERWGWVLDEEAVRNSNFWRAQRGEEPLEVGVGDE